jgi:hypothetical protein
MPGLNVQEMARDAAGNHERFDSFSWHSPPDDAENWTIVYVRSRDSGLLEQSNSDAIEKELQPFIDAGDVLPEHHGHWAVGWVDGFAIRVWDDDGEVTEAFQAWCYLQERLGTYPVLDETDYSNREYDATLENIESEGQRHIRDDAPDDWPSRVFSWLWDHAQRELENRDDQGASPSWEAVREALIELDFLDAWYQVRVGETTVLETQSRAKAEKEFANICWYASLGLEQAKVSLWCDDDELLDEKGA